MLSLISAKLSQIKKDSCQYCPKPHFSRAFPNFWRAVYIHHCKTMVSPASFRTAPVQPQIKTGTLHLLGLPDAACTGRKTKIRKQTQRTKHETSVMYVKSLLLSHHHSTSALVSEILESVLQTVQKNKTIYI